MGGKVSASRRQKRESYDFLNNVVEERSNERYIYNDEKDARHGDKKDARHGDQKDARHGDEKDGRHGDENDTRHGDERDTRHGNKKDTRHGNKKDTRHGDERDARHGDQKDARHGDQKDARHGDQKDARHGDERDTRHGNKKDTRHGDESDTRHGDKSDTRHGDKSDTRHGDEKDARHGDKKDTRHGDKSDTRHGDKSDTRHGDEKDARHGDKKDARHGDERDTRHGNKKDTRHGDESDTRHGDEKDARHGDKKDARHGDERDARHGDQKDARHGDQKDARHGDQKDARHGDEKDGRHGDGNDTRHGDERDARHEEELISDSEESSSWITKEEENKFYDPADTTLTFVEGEDDLDFLLADYKSLRAKMSCGHAVTPTSLTNWCYYLLDESDCKFVCGLCDVEWPLEEVCKMALLTPKEIDDLEKKVFQTAAKDFLDIKFCPGCKSCVMRTDLHNLSVECPVCTAKRGRTYIFCWQCLKKWKGPSPRSDRCANGDCQNPLDILKSCPEITFENVEGVTGCPSIRACPTCGLIVEHNRIDCKNIVCVRCKLEFCFVCLKLTKDCADEKNIITFFNLCSGGVAPRQTSMPVWQRTSVDSAL